MNITTEKRPWGTFEQFTYNELSTVKILKVLPGKRLSLQSHQHRQEMWIALDNGVVTEVDGKKMILKAGQRITIPQGARHRLSSAPTASTALRVLEISFGTFDEQDITRYEDDFGRL